MTSTTTLRETARTNVAAAVVQAAEYQHARNYYKLHVYRNGAVAWHEFVNRTDDIIDRHADDFRAIPSVITTGTGSFGCNCDYCNNVYRAADEASALENEEPYDKAAKYPTKAAAVADAIGDGDLSDLEEEVLASFDAIPAGYFEDEGRA